MDALRSRSGLLMHFEASPLFHANHADDAFIRVGDKSKKLNFEDRMALMYAKGVRYYEDEPVADATIEDLDLGFVRDYCKKIGYSKSPEEIEHIKSMRADGVMTAITSSAVIAVLEDLRKNQVIGTQDVQKILDCKETKALRIITEMKKANVIVAVTGQGKGRYILSI